MGVCSSAPSRRLDAQRVSRMLQDNLKLDKQSERDLIRAYRLFKKTDTNGDGRIQKSEFAKAFKLDQDVFFERLFSLIDTDGSEYIDFREFVIVLGGFKLSNAAGRVRFAFRLLDLDDSGTISKDEFKACIQASVNMIRNRTKEGRRRARENDWRDKAPRDIYAAYKDLFKQLDEVRGSGIGYQHFANICVRYPKLFTPINHIWATLRRYSVPAAELCKVIARAGHQGFFHNSILEFGWPGVKFAAPPWKQQDRNVYMRSLSNLFKRRGTSLDEEDARASVGRNGRRSRSSLGHSGSNGVGSTSRRRHRTERDPRHERHDADRHVRPAHTTSVPVLRQPSRFDDARPDARGHRRADAGPAYPGPKFCRQFSWGSDDPETEIGKRELLASESLDRAYREQYPADEQTESWLEDDMRDPSASRQDSTLDRRDSIEEIWNALQACPSAQAARSYSRKDYVPDEYYRRLEDGVYYKKNFAASVSSGLPPPVYQHERTY